MSSDRTLTGDASEVGGDDEPGFAPDELVGDRYRIEHRLGRGGMGDVYAAEDLELGERVALKTIRSDVAREPGMLERFRRETQLARKITHANVCRVFDLGRHGEGAFLTMELLGGETLAERLVRAGPLAIADVEPLAVQVARGLAAAHAAGVIHRDLKCANIMLVGDRPVITDFGVARASAGGDGLTAPSAIAGTPAYMAPEQLEGAKVGPEADVYAFGVVLHEVLTGRRPVEGPERLPRWNDLIRRCLDRAPSRRPRSSELAALIAAPRRRRRPLFAIVAIAGAIVASAAAAVAIFVPREPAPVVTPAARRSVAVLGFKDLTARPETAWISTALAEMLTTELAAGDALRAVPGQTVARARLDIGLPAADAYAPDALARLGVTLGVDTVVHGRYLTAGGRMRFEVHVQDTRTGDTITALTESGPEDDLLELVARAGRRLRLALGIDDPSSTTPLAARPGSAEAARLYAEGLARLRRFDGIGARDHLTAAIAADPRFAMAHSALAEAYTLLGYEARAGEAAAQASSLGVGLGRADRLLVEAQGHEAASRHAEAAERYRTLWEFFPDNLEYGLALAGAQAAAGRTADSDATLAALRAMPAPLGDDPRIDLVDATAARLTGDHTRRRAAAARAATEGAARGSRLSVALARIDEGWASFFLGEPARAESAFADARILAGSVGARSVVAGALLGTGLVAFQSGRVAEGRRHHEECLAIRREIGELSGVAESQAQLGFVLEEMGELEESERMLREALALGRRLDLTHVLGYVHLHQAWLDTARGDLQRARQDFGEARAVFEGLGNQWLAAGGIYGEGEVAYQQADMAGAAVAAERSLALLRGAGMIYASYNQHAVARAWAAAGRLDEARALHEEALARRRRYGLRRTEPESLYELALLARDEGRLADATTLAREAADGLGAVSALVKEALARGLLAGLLADGGQDVAARAELARVRAAEARLGSSSVRVAAEIAAAEISAAAGERGANRKLAAAATLAATAGHTERELRTLLVLGRHLVRTGELAAGRRTLADVARRAGEKQWIWLAREAAR